MQGHLTRSDAVFNVDGLAELEEHVLSGNDVRPSMADGIGNRQSIPSLYIRPPCEIVRKLRAYIVNHQSRFRAFKQGLIALRH